MPNETKKCFICSSEHLQDVFFRISHTQQEGWCCTRCLHALIHGHTPENLRVRIQEMQRENRTTPNP